MKRCSWVTDNQTYIKYHDIEWGVPLHDDIKLILLKFPNGTAKKLVVYYKTQEL